MRILFYLPVITPWWFDKIVEPLIRRLAAAHEVHVLAPVWWNGTGIGPRELTALADLEDVRWHVFDGDSHPTMRFAPSDRSAIVEHVAGIAPDYVLCRSADCETVRRFPGIVRHMMEGAAAPFSIPTEWIVLREDPFDHGLLPDLDGGERAQLDRLVAPLWDRLAPALRGEDEPHGFEEWAKLPDDRPILMLPLEYEHEENHYAKLRVGAFPNHRLIAELAATIDDRFFVAITDHPLNTHYVDSAKVEAEIASHRGRMRLLPGTSPTGTNTTKALARRAAGMLVGDSKAYSLAAFFGTPLLRRSQFRTGDWLNAHNDVGSLLEAIGTGTAIGPDRRQARTWFAFHIANEVIDPNDPELGAAQILAHLDRPVDPVRWERGFARHSAVASGRLA